MSASPKHPPTLPPSMKSTASVGSDLSATKQRAVYSELLSQDIPASSVAATGNFHVHEFKLQGDVSASSFTHPGEASLSAEAAEVNAFFDDPAVEPKVISPFVTRPGHIPRKIEIERKKRLYAAQDIEMLLQAKGIDYAGALTTTLTNVQQKLPVIPLEAFDNTSYEVRTPQEWLQRGLRRDSPKRGKN